ncbi:MAG: tRNA (adenosine(37)-N6)-threonylcarbamoyltransferase complex ATPase subunit type 1 TsaE [Lachnospiraceae bacterium]|nr:tRNA (adenosine(37)-N6)-threonylcarbamoyltransferase complex ATPase subunit type 1 TsaE [Lachnospiraceae bacterium]
MNTKTIETNSPEETYNFAKAFAEQTKPGTIITLSGDLGVGKTVFAQGFAAGLGITEPVSSPTFTILQTYDEGRMPFYHFDVYRIADPEEMYEIGYEDCFFGDGVCLVEWASLIEELLPEDITEVIIEKNTEKGFDYRRITVNTP